MPFNNSARFPWGARKTTLVLAIVGVSAAAVLMATRPVSEPAEATTIRRAPRTASVELTAKTTAPAPAARRATTKRAQATPAAAARTSTPSTRTPLVAAAAAPVVTAAATTGTAEPASKAVVQEVVTLSGCLDENDGRFRLKDTAGDDAPKSRSWKSGFLRKGSASVEIVDAANRHRLPTHVGQRVSVTGMLSEREMQVRSLRRVGEACD